MAKKYLASQWKTLLTDPRHLAVVDGFEKVFGAGKEISLFSAPGRTEIGGNHTDHQHGRALAASINLEAVAAVCENDLGQMRIHSEGHSFCVVDVDDLSIHEEEKNSSMSLIRGVASAFQDMGCPVRGFDAYVSSNVLRGSGLSSSAAFEVLLGVILNGLFFENKASATRIAQIGQYAENVYFGKPSGLLDQMASSVGNLVAMDFNDPKNPIVEKVDFDFAKTGYSLCIIDSGADHADLTDEYAAIPMELKVISQHFGKEVLRDIPEEDFYRELPTLRALAGDRAVLRAIHFYGDNARVPKQVQALKDGDFDTFLNLMKESGRSSWMYLQNVIPAGYKAHQEMGVALALCEKLLGGKGAFRVHGGGFAGTVQAFVPNDMLETFRTEMERVLGAGSCHVLSIRPMGGVEL